MDGYSHFQKQRRAISADRLPVDSVSSTKVSKEEAREVIRHMLNVVQPRTKTMKQMKAKLLSSSSVSAAPSTKPLKTISRAPSIKECLFWECLPWEARRGSRSRGSGSARRANSQDPK